MSTRICLLPYGSTTKENDYIFDLVLPIEITTAEVDGICYSFGYPKLYTSIKNDKRISSSARELAQVIEEVREDCL